MREKEEQMKSMKLAEKVIPFTVRMASKDLFCQKTFSVQLMKSEKLCFDYRLSVSHIRTLLYFKALGATGTCVKSVADDLRLSRSEIIAAIQRLRRDGFIVDTPLA